MEQLREFLGWLFSEAGAGWIVAIGAAIAWMLERRRRERPPKVIIQEIARTRLLDIHPSQQHKVSVRYNHQDSTLPITELEQREFAIYNNGTQDIHEPVRFTLVFDREDEGKKKYGIYDWSFDTLDYKISSIPDLATVGYEIEFPYLNSYALHETFIRAYLITDGDVDIELFKGSGRGWSVAFLPSLKIAVMGALYDRYSLTIGWVLLLLHVLASTAIALTIIAGRAPSFNFVVFSFIGLILSLLLHLLLLIFVQRQRENVVAARLGILPTSAFKH